MLTGLDPTGGSLGHDKIEGVATTDHGRTLTISNDSDFGISGISNTTAPYQLQAKILPDGQQDDGEYLSVDTTRLDDATSTATVSVHVLPPGACTAGRHIGVEGNRRRTVDEPGR